MAEGEVEDETVAHNEKDGEIEELGDCDSTALGDTDDDLVIFTVTDRETVTVELTDAVEQIDGVTVDELVELVEILSVGEALPENVAEFELMTERENIAV